MWACSCRTAYFISSHAGPLPREGFAELLDCGLLTQAPSLQSLEQVLHLQFCNRIVIAQCEVSSAGAAIETRLQDYMP